MQRLVISLEARTKAFENQLKKSNAIAQKQLRGIEKQFNDTNKRVAVQSRQMGNSMSAMFGGAGGRMAGAAGLALAAREVQKYADAWTEAGNKIAAASQISGRQARSLGELNDIAKATRSGITETVDLYAKLLRSTKDVAKSEEEVARATEIVNKAFKAGGAAASEQTAGILQLSQALGSGNLQGDELRSIRENAPLVAEAIAKEFGTTIAGLKDLGAEGKLSTDRVFKAILNAQPEIEKAFAATTATIGDSFKILGNTLTETVGRLSDISGASGKVNDKLGELVVIVETLTSGFEYIAGSPAGKFLGFLDDVLDRLNPVNQALKILGDQKLKDELAAVGAGVLSGEGDTDTQIKRARKELEKFFDAARRGNKGGFLSNEQTAALERLRQQLRDGKIDAEGARKAVAAIGAMKPGTADELTGRFDHWLEKLAGLQRSAKAAAKAVALLGLNDDERGAMRASRTEDTEYAKFIADRNSDAKRTELEKDIDTRTDAILEAANKIGVSMTEAAAKIQAKGELAAEATAKATAATAKSSMELIKEFEGFRPKPYFDVNAYRVGYGSDTVTLDDGSIKKVTQGISVTLEGATRDLARRIEEFQAGIKSDIGADTFNNFSEKQQAALTSIAYNYGSLPDRIIDAIKNGTTADVYAAIKGLGSDNGGVNRDRRNSEAQIFLSDAPSGIKKGIDSEEDFAKRLAEQKAYIAALQAETGIRATLNPLVNDYGLAMGTVQAAQELLTAAQEEGTAAGLELKDVQQLLYGDLTKLSPAALTQAMAMRELANQTGAAESAGNRLTESQEKLQARLSESSALGKDVLGGFIRDLREGKSATEALASALDKVADKLLDMALNSLFDGAGGAGSGGGILGGLFSMFFAKNGGVYAGGKPQPMKTFARGGVSRSAAIFGEAGPEAAVPLPDGRRIPVDLRGPAGMGGSTETIRVVLQDDSGRMASIADQRIKTASGTIVQVSVQQSQRAVKNSLPSMIANAQTRSM